MTDYLTDHQIADLAIRGMAIDRAVELVRHGATHQSAAEAAGVTRAEVTTAVRELHEQTGETFGTVEAGPGTPDLLAAVRDGAWLDAQTFPPLKYAVPGIIPEGFTLLIGPPKAGKSWLALAILLGLATGGRVLGGIRVPKGRVLYLALEDGHRRMQDRARTLMADEPLPAEFCYITRINPGDIIATIEAYLERHPDTVLVVIDTLGKVLPPAAPNETTYSRDYRIGGRIKAIADARPGLAVAALHHDRKAASDDFVERVSGTNGLAGAADTIIVLSRARQSEDGTLSVTGRDVVESEYALTLVGGAWALDGAGLSEAARRVSERKAVAGLGDRSVDIITYALAQPGEVTPVMVAAAFALDNDTAGKYLRRAAEAGRLHRVGRGRYVPVRSVRTSEMEPETDTDFGQSDASDTLPWGDQP